MKKRLDCILLIDDSAAVNVYNEALIKRADCCDLVLHARHGKEALEILTTPEKGRFPRPDIIFLDINMPIMNGWEFLEEYQKLDQSMKGEILVVMLTSSLSPDDREKAEKIEEVSEFCNKPISLEMLNEIIEKYF